MSEEIKKKILIIDDQEDILDFTSLVLKEYGDFDVICAVNGQEGLDKSIDHQPDFILIDTWLPDIDGHEVCNKIKTNDKTKHIKVAMFTALVSDKEKIKSKQNLADDFIEKPFAPEDLISRINKILNKDKK